MLHIQTVPPKLKDFHKHHLTWRWKPTTQPYCEARHLLLITQTRKLSSGNRGLPEGPTSRKWSQNSKFMSSQQLLCPSAILCWFSPGLKPTAKQSNRCLILWFTLNASTVQQMFVRSQLYKASPQTSLKTRETLVAFNCLDSCFIQTKYIVQKL